MKQNGYSSYVCIIYRYTYTYTQGGKEGIPRRKTSSGTLLLQRERGLNRNTKHDMYLIRGSVGA